MENAKVLQGQQMAMLQQLGPYQSSVSGVISEISPNKDDSGAESFLGGVLSQDIILSQSAASAASVQQLASVPMVHQNSNFYDSTVSKVKAILNTVQACSEPELEGIFNTKLSVLIGEIQELVIEIFGNDSSFTGKYVTLSVPVDRRQKCKRIKSKSEPQRPTKQLYRGERTQVLLSVSSLINTGDNEH